MSQCFQPEEMMHVGWIYFSIRVESIDLGISEKNEKKKETTKINKYWILCLKL